MAASLRSYSTLLTSSKYRDLWTFLLFWLVTFILYIPAANAGFVFDFTGWLDQVKNASFSDYLHRRNFAVNSMYQFTQFTTWIFYQLFGTNTWAWHILFVTLQALNACLLFRLAFYMLSRSGVNNAFQIGLTASSLFCITPLISEVIVWEPSFHYLQGLLIIVAILLWTIRFLETGKMKFTFFILTLYIFSVFSLEYFYLTPFFLLSLALYHHYAFEKSNKLKKLTLYAFIPMLLIILLRILLFHYLYHDWVSRIGANILKGDLLPFAAKPLKYLFHILFFGRFWGDEQKNIVYACCESAKVLYAFCGLLFCLAVYYVLRFRKLGNGFRITGLLIFWLTLAALLVTPMWFTSDVLVQMDRYTYLMLPSVFLLLCLLLWKLPRKVALGVVTIYALANIGFTLKTNRYWYQSANIISNLLHHFPDPQGKVTLLLNVPEQMNGISMIGTGFHGEFKMMYNLLMPKKITSKVYDVIGFNMITHWDGAYVTVVNDSTIHVTLNQSGTWWWYAGKGAVTYENEDFKLDLKDWTHWYELTLKKPASNYHLLYLVDGDWKKVDMGLVGKEQL
jgi:hypothetical protein